MELKRNMFTWFVLFQSANLPNVHTTFFKALVFKFIFNWLKTFSKFKSIKIIKCKHFFSTSYSFFSLFRSGLFILWLLQYNIISFFISVFLRLPILVAKRIQINGTLTRYVKKFFTHFQKNLDRWEAELFSWAAWYWAQIKIHLK